ncbi:hypothetical protein Q8A73_003908 [Channa argus]|nr:hypothetical protein Q8A73_003908 [Channa argus]
MKRRTCWWQIDRGVFRLKEKDPEDGDADCCNSVRIHVTYPVSSCIIGHDLAPQQCPLGDSPKQHNRGVCFLLFASPITDKTDLVGINLIVCDLFLTFVSLLTMSDIFFIHQFFQHMWSFLLSLVNYGRPLFQAVLCLERYLAVQHPIVFLRCRPLRYRELAGNKKEGMLVEEDWPRN